MRGAGAARLTSPIMSSIVSSPRMPLERINLNVTPEMRRQLRAVAKRLRKSEAEVARDLLADALERTRRHHFHARVAEQMTPELRARMVAIAEALESLDG